MHNMELFIVGKDYQLDVIEDKLQECNFNYTGPYILGERFVSITSETNDSKTVSFILTSSTGASDIFTCVYNNTPPKPELVKKSYVILTSDNEWIATGYLETPDIIAATVAECKENRPDAEMILFESVNSYVI